MTNEPVNTTVFAEATAALKGKNIIAVVSGHRNCGKTWFSVTLANALGLFKQKVLLFDADSGITNVRSQIGANAKKELDEVIFSGYSLNQTVSNYDKGRFDIIVNNSRSTGLKTMSIGRLHILGDDLDILAQSYDKTILDISAGIDNSSKVLSGLAQSIIVICTNDPQSITKSYELIKQISSHYSNKVIKIVINQVNSIEEGMRAYSVLLKACQEFLKISPSLLGVIRQDTRVRDSIRNQNTIINRYPQSEAALDVIAIAKRILNNEQFN